MADSAPQTARESDGPQVHDRDTTSLIADVTDAQMEQLQASVVAYTAAHGISMVADAASSSSLLVHAPVTLLPTPLDEASYLRVAALSPLWNTLVDRVSRDEAFLLRHLEGPAQADPWLRRMLDVLVRLRKEGHAVTQPLRLGVYRSDYMIHVDEEGTEEAVTTSADATSGAANGAAASPSSPARLRHTPLQVELNTMAASFMGLSTRVAAMHRFMLQRELDMPRARVQQLTPDNDAVGNIARAMSVAFQLYKQQHPSPRLCVVIVVQPGESNAVDQRILEYTLWENHSIPVVRRTLRELAEHASLDSAGQLVLDHGAHHAAIVYFRAGYTPRDFPSDLEYEAVYRVERSVAIKCPSLATHLAGAKKVQQVLADPAELQRFLAPDECKQLQSCFAGLYALNEDDDATRRIIDEAIAHPSKFVLKPQREGGGNNLWADDMVAALKRMTKEERAAFILMEKIDPRPTRSALLRRGELQVAPALSELGIYSAFVGDGTRTHHSELCGHLLRTKMVGVDEGGVAAGFSCISSVIFA